jgi:hypothetical protein
MTGRSRFPFAQRDYSFPFKAAKKLTTKRSLEELPDDPFPGEQLSSVDRGRGRRTVDPGVAPVDPQDPRRVALDGGEQHLSFARGGLDRGQPAQPGLGMTGKGVGVDEPPVRGRAIEPLVDLLP